MLKVLRNAWNSEIRLNLKQWLRIGGFHWLHLCCFTAIGKWGQTSSHLLKTSSFKLIDSNRQPVYYYNEHGQVEIVVITLKEFLQLTFLSFGIPNANRWDVEFSLSNALKVLRNACQSEIRLNLKQCLRFPLFHHKDAQSAPKRLPEWNKTKFETMPQISTFSSQRCSKCSKTLARVK